MEREVEVVGVTRSTDFITGKTIYSVQFGEIGTVNPRPYTNVPPAISVSATLFVDFDKCAPYKVGTKWKMTVDEIDGAVTLRPSDVSVL